MTHSTGSGQPDELPPAETLQADEPTRTTGYRPLLVLSVCVLTAFVGISGYVLWDDKASAEMRGGLIQTWNNLAVMVAGFWFGSNVASKVNRLKSGQ